MVLWVKRFCRVKHALSAEPRTSKVKETYMARPRRIEYQEIVDYWIDAVSTEGKCTKVRVAKFYGVSVRTVERGLKWGIQQGRLPEDTFGYSPFNPKAAVAPFGLQIAWT